jgi:hypothetical protein
MAFPRVLRGPGGLYVAGVSDTESDGDYARSVGKTAAAARQCQQTVSTHSARYAWLSYYSQILGLDSGDMGQTPAN